MPGKMPDKETYAVALCSMYSSVNLIFDIKKCIIRSKLLPSYLRTGYPVKT